MTYAQILKSTFDNYFIAPIETWEEFFENCEIVNFKKDEVIKSANTTER